jgi:hypothetical protein
MQWLAWILGLAAVLLVAISIGRLFVQQGRESQERRPSPRIHVKGRRLSPSRWLL